MYLMCSKHSGQKSIYTNSGSQNIRILCMYIIRIRIVFILSVLEEIFSFYQTTTHCYNSQQAIFLPQESFIYMSNVADRKCLHAASFLFVPLWWQPPILQAIFNHNFSVCFFMCLFADLAFLLFPFDMHLIYAFPSVERNVRQTKNCIALPHGSNIPFLTNFVDIRVSDPKLCRHKNPLLLGLSSRTKKGLSTEGQER